MRLAYRCYLLTSKTHFTSCSAVDSLVRCFHGFVHNFCTKYFSRRSSIDRESFPLQTIWTGWLRPQVVFCVLFLSPLLFPQHEELSRFLLGEQRLTVLLVQFRDLMTVHDKTRSRSPRPTGENRSKRNLWRKVNADLSWGHLLTLCASATTCTSYSVDNTEPEVVFTSLPVPFFHDLLGM